MKENKKIILLCFLVLAFLLILSTKVKANSIDQVTMDIYLDKYGNGYVTEVWDASLTQGTEGYRTYKYLENSTISNFTVSDDFGRKYETLSNWNIDGSFNSKAYKCGIHEIENGLELCWGISNYGSRRYILRYEISNIVTQYVDAQGIDFNFLNLDQQVNNAKITIHSDTLFFQNNAQIWAFGYDGTINFNNGNIVLDSKGIISTNQYMVALVKFDGNIFNTTNTSKLYFKNAYDAATYGVKSLKKEPKKIDTNTYYLLFYIPMIILAVFLILYILIGIIVIISKEHADAIKRKELLVSVQCGEYGDRLPKINNIEYYRDIPCGGDLGYAYWLCVKYSIVSERTLRKNIVGSILLKWIRNGYITISKTDKRFI